LFARAKKSKPHRLSFTSYRIKSLFYSSPGACSLAFGLGGSATKASQLGMKYDYAHPHSERVRARLHEWVNFSVPEFFDVFVL
jgi:hypothetical protein